ncbi:CheR family methyltransferase [Paludibaculum fermentans]|uniref:protein-glutamate O-methyltransferase n=1 Tax=Paludibaculum fermentans TaxID=1473598 RepID=A0A7S7NKA3_PALFE|nr:CheR family methyltransferase [Paludibaculum fermentans]QOY85196.1 methyltransferase domain-containing protein [Paludibaculum fermentans]
MRRADIGVNGDVPDGLIELSREGFARFANYITCQLGIKMPESKMPLVQSRLMRRVRELKMRSLNEYEEYFFAASHGSEREHLINAMTTNKTDFFREAGHFEFLRNIAIPTLMRSSSRIDSRLKVWSAGCSSGEEPYTIAMVLAEYASVNTGFDFAVLGTDISTKVLRHAQSGIYAESLIEPVPKEMRGKYLLKSRNRAEERVRIIPGLRKKVSFHQLNFMEADYRIKDMFDVVFFRNVLIYFDLKTQEEVVNRICRNLNPGGYFFASHSESLSALDVPLRSIGTAIYQRREGALVQGKD